MRNPTRTAAAIVLTVIGALVFFLLRAAIGPLSVWQALIVLILVLWARTEPAAPPRVLACAAATLALLSNVIYECAAVLEMTDRALTASTSSLARALVESGTTEHVATDARTGALLGLVGSCCLWFYIQSKTSWSFWGLSMIAIIGGLFLEALLGQS